MTHLAHHVEIAYWTTRFDGVVELSRDWDGVELPPLGLAAPARLRRFQRMKPWRWARFSGYFFENGLPVFLLPGDTCHLALDNAEKVRVAGPFNDWKPDVTWQLELEKQDGEPVFVLHVRQENWHGAWCHKGCDFKFITDGGTWLEPLSMATNRVKDSTGNTNLHLCNQRTGQHVFCFVSETPANLAGHDNILWADATNSHTTAIRHGNFLLHQDSTLEMGARVINGQTRFRLFAPRATNVVVELWPPGHKDRVYCERLALVAHGDGVWEVTWAGSLHGWRYQYFISGENLDASTDFDDSHAVLDPWALATLGPAGPGIVIDMARIPFPQTQYTPPAPTDAIILEAHVRDLMARVPGAGPRAGFRELATWIRSPHCYLRALGINVLELQPIQEFDAQKPDDYHWGYMPTNWFSPASAYARDPSNASQIEDFQELVRACHEVGIAIVLDVVYNHVGVPNPFLRIDKGYYLETAPDGNLTNWSGCGNDIRPDAPMLRRLVLATLQHFIECYDVDGFRFDLAELLGLPMLSEIERELRPRKHGLLLIAEPWSFRGHIGHALSRTGFASWSDGYREFFPAWVHGAAGTDALRHFITGADRPAATVNYTESHDDLCWLDRITENACNNGGQPSSNDAQRTRLMGATLMASLGIPMLAEGQDFLRSKNGISNTYLRGDLNALDYVRLESFKDTHAYFRSWIAFRLSADGAALRHSKRPQSGFFRFFENERQGVLGILYNADGKLPCAPLFVALNPQPESVELCVHGVDAAGFRQLANGTHFYPGGLPRTECFAWHSGTLRIPPLSAGLWQTVSEEHA